MSLLFLAETTLMLVPALALRFRANRETPRRLLMLAVLACMGGMMYRFDPTTVAFSGGGGSTYFPSLPEVLITIGYISLAIVVFMLAVKFFAVLPAELAEWHYVFKLARRRRATASKGHAS